MIMRTHLHKHKQTCRVRAAQKPAHINIWCNDHAYTSTSDVISPYPGPPELPRPESTDLLRWSDPPRQRDGAVCDYADESKHKQTCRVMVAHI